MKPMLTIALAAALFAGVAAPSFAAEFDSNSAFQDGIIGNLADQAGIETASSQLQAMLLAEAERDAVTESAERIAGTLITGEAARIARTVRAHQRHEGSALVTTDYEFSRNEVYRALERNR